MVTLARRVLGQQGKEEVEVAMIPQRRAHDEVGQEIAIDLLPEGRADALRDVLGALRLVSE